MSAQARRGLARLAHFGRLALVAAIVWQLTTRASREAPGALPHEPEVGLLSWVEDQRVVSTSPEGDAVAGWAGPTTVQFVLDQEGRVEQALILRSADSASYVRRIAEHASFLPSLQGLSLEQLGGWQVDAVSGATLTSRAIQNAVRLKFAGTPPPSPFPPLPSELVVLAEGEELIEAEVLPKLGYQGPTQVLLILSEEGVLQRALMGESFDNEPYIEDVRTDRSFWALFEGLTLEEVAALQAGPGGVEGVSGATMTSQGIVRSLQATAARRLRQESQSPASSLQLARSPRELLGWMVGGAALLVLVTPLRLRRAARKALRVGVVLGFGVGAGALLSLDSAWSWAQHGLPWQSAPLLAGFVLAAVLGPALLGRKTYCRSLCAHGALQQLLAPRASHKLAPRVDAAFRRLPGLLLLTAVGMLLLATRDAGAGVELASWEPFAAWNPQNAAMASLILAGLSVLAAAWVPLAYCHYGCPTGALLDYLRDQPSRFLKPADAGAALLLVASLTL